MGGMDYAWGELCGAQSAQGVPGRLLAVGVSLVAAGFGREGDGDILVPERVPPIGEHRCSPVAADGQSRQERGVPVERAGGWQPCAEPCRGWGRCLPAASGACILRLHPSPASLPPRGAAACRHVRAAARRGGGEQGHTQAARGGGVWGGDEGSERGSHPGFPTAPRGAGGGGLGGGWWMPGARFFMVSEGSINSLNIQPFQVGFVEN